MHVYATQALALRLVLCLRTTREVGNTDISGEKYYVFQDPKADSGEKIMKLQITKSPISFQRTSLILTVSTAKKKLGVSGTSVSHLVQPSSRMLLTTPAADGILATSSLEISEKDLWKTASSSAPVETVAFTTRWAETPESSILVWPSASREAPSNTDSYNKLCGGR